MKIYTKQGDAGQTGLFGGARVSKDHLRIRAYGTLDELNATLGLLTCEGSPAPAEMRAHLLKIQAELFQLGSELATPRGKELSIALLEERAVTALEVAIDALEKPLAPLKTFILPGGSRASAEAHLARTIARRAEREMVVLDRAESLRPVVLQYVNRLSDYLFTVARALNHQLKIADLPWTPEKV